MNFQTAGIVGGVAFLLSTLAGLIGGVPFLDILVRAFFWGALGFGLSLGIEVSLRNFLPDLFVPEEKEAADEVPSERRVDITLEGGTGNVFEEVGDETSRPRPAAAAPVEAVVHAAPAPADATQNPDDTEEMPEIGAFLEAFKPNAPEEGEGEEGASSAPEYVEYAPSDRRSNRDAAMGEQEQDPAILAKAIQTVMKRDGQGN